METIVRRISYPIMALLIALPVMFRGLFFEYDFSVYAAIALGVIAICAYFAKDIKFNAQTDTSLAILVALYGFTCVFAVNKGLAVTELLKYVAIFAVYLFVKGVSKSEGGKIAVMCALVAAVGVSSIISLLTAAGVLNYGGAYSASEIEKWLNGTVQYHNAFGAIAVMALFIASALNKNGLKFIKIPNAVLGYFIAFGMIMSYSRGAWVTAPVAFVVYMIFADKQARLSFFEIALSGVIATVAVLGKFTLFVESGNKTSALLWLLIGFVIYAALYVLISYVFHIFKDKKHFNKVMITGVCAVVALAMIVVLFPNIFAGILPAQLAERLSGINFGTETVKERFVFYKDAYSIAKQSPLLGSGGGAWQDLYGMHQSYLYFSNQAHSYIMQLFIETGAAGLLVWIFTIVMFYVTAIKCKKRQKDCKILAGTVSAVTVLIVHSFIDFDLSITAISIMLWALFAVIFSYETKKEYTVNKYIGIVVCALLIIPFVCNGAGIKAYEKGGELLSKKQYKLANEEFATAVTLRPYDADALSYKALSLAMSMEERTDREIIVADMDKAEVLAPNSFIVVQNAGTVYSRLGVIDVAMSYARKAVELRPMDIENYRAYLISAYECKRYYYDQGLNYGLAKKIADEVLTIEPFVEQLNSKRIGQIVFDDEMFNILRHLEVMSNNVITAK